MRFMDHKKNYPSKQFDFENFNFDGWWIYEPGIENEFFIAPFLKKMLGVENEMVPFSLEWFSERIHSRERQGFLDTVKKPNQETKNLEYRLKMADGNYKWMLCRVKTDKDQKRISGIQTDITIQKETELQLIRSNKELEQFAYISSHDLQSPLRHIWTFGDLARININKDKKEQAIQNIEKVLTTCGHLKNLVSDLLNYSRLGRNQITFSNSNINSLISHAQNILADQIEASGATFTIPTNLPKKLLVNEEYLIDVFVNLFSNAIKYKKESEQPKIDISYRLENHKNVFSITDNGIGIPAHELESIFDIFKRSSSESSLRKPGSGIGLSTVKKIIELHGGSIEVNSEEGAYSTFKFSI